MLLITSNVIWAQFVWNHFASRCINFDWSRLTTILLISAVGSFEQYNIVDLKFTCHSIEWSMIVVVLALVPFYNDMYMFMSSNLYVSSYDCFHISFIYIFLKILFLYVRKFAFPSFVSRNRYFRWYFARHLGRDKMRISHLVFTTSLKRKRNLS
jgi:hypothetical protein